MSNAATNERTIAGKYRPIVELGRGGMAVVYLAVVRGPADFNKLQVIKRLRPELTNDAEQVSMFLNEARVSARINHPNVVQINEIGRDGDDYFMAMEYIDGQPLERLFRKCKGEVPLNLHLKIIAEALSGLHAAHELKDFDGSPLEIVHRDVSPHNVLVGYEGEVKVLDFGIAKVAGSRSETRTGVLKGKFTYMAPEQFMGQKIDRRTDVFAAGVMLWQAVARRRLWSREIHEIEVYRRVIEADIPRPRDIDPHVPPELDEMVMKALATDPAKRHQSADELRGAIEDYLSRATPHPTARALGALVQKQFAEERQAVRTAIETRVRDAINDVTPEVPRLRAVLPQSLRDSERASSSLVTGRSSSGSSASGSGASRSSLSEAPFLSNITASGALPWYRQGRVLGAGAAALLVAIVLLLWQPWHGSRPKTTDVALAAGSPAAVQAASVTSAAPASTLTVLTVHAAPANAKIFIDDIDVAGNPFVGKFMRDGASHRVRVEAQGFASKSVRVEFSAETASVELALDKAAPTWSPPRKGRSPSTSDQTASAPAANAAAPASAPPAASNADAKSKADDPWSKRKKPSFDSTDPWK